MIKVRFCTLFADKDKFAFYKIPDDIEVCDKCEFFYRAEDVDKLLEKIKEAIDKIAETEGLNI